MSYHGYKPYVPVAQRRLSAVKAATRAKKAGIEYTPVLPYRGAIAKTFWGKAWCDNLEQYSDYSNRLPRGRTYVRNGSVIDLKISGGAVNALVMGSSLYTVNISVQPVAVPRWKAICTDCASSIDSLVALLQGRLAKPVMERICQPQTGLFPAPADIKFDCSCPDWATMCKHVAAVLYGVGARLDSQPELLFTLRQVDAKDLVAQAGAGLPTTGKAPVPSHVLDDAALADVFGLEMADAAPVPKPTASAGKSGATKSSKTATRTAVGKKAVATKATKKTTPAKADATTAKVKAVKTVKTPTKVVKQAVAVKVPAKPRQTKA